MPETETKQHSEDADALDFLCNKMSNIKVQQSDSAVPSLSDVSYEQFDRLKQQLNSLSISNVREALVEFRKLVAHDDVHPHLDRVLQHQVVPRFVECLQMDDNECQFEAAWILTNTAAGSSNQTEHVVKCGAVVPLVALMRDSPHKGIREQSVWCLGNITGDGVALRSTVLQAGAMKPLLDLITEEMNYYLSAAPVQLDEFQQIIAASALNITSPTSPTNVPKKNRQYTLSTLRICMWALSNFCRGNGTTQLDYELLEIALPVLSQVIVCCAPNTVNCDDEILMDACWALSRTLRGINENTDKVVVNVQVCQILGALTTYENPDVQIPALRCLINIVSGSDHQTQQVIDARVLAHLLQLLIKPPNDTILKETCLIVSNITAGTKEQVDVVMGEHEGLIMQRLVDILANPSYRIRREACWALSNGCLNRNYEHIKFMFDCGMLQPMMAMLISTTHVQLQDDRAALKTLEAVRNILACGEMNMQVQIKSNTMLDQLAEMSIQKDSAFSSSTDLYAGDPCAKVNPFKSLFYMPLLVSKLRPDLSTFGDKTVTGVELIRNKTKADGFNSEAIRNMATDIMNRWFPFDK